jgi:hypothetical protein
MERRAKHPFRFNDSGRSETAFRHVLACGRFNGVPRTDGGNDREIFAEHSRQTTAYREHVE